MSRDRAKLEQTVFVSAKTHHMTLRHLV